jgi:hypothetical protein
MVEMFVCGEDQKKTNQKKKRYQKIFPSEDIQKNFFKQNKYKKKKKKI